jgi:GNAT superfamily N-acetyltransferase
MNENLSSIEFLRTSSSNPYFQLLIQALDEDLYKRNGEGQLIYRQYNQVDQIKHVMIVYLDGEPVGCGCFKKFDPETVEMKRMYVLPEMRGKQLAAKLLQELEKWAVEEGFHNAVLETGLRQVEAIRLYTVAGYLRTENYGQYIGMADSICYRKTLK